MAATRSAAGRHAVIDDHPTGSLVVYEPGHLGTRARRRMRAELEHRRAQFESGPMRVEGRSLPTPRLVAAFGDGAYAYPDMGASLPWPPTLLAARERLQAAAGHRFNYALVNWYRDGRDHTGWHADKMHMHVPGSAIAVLSLGAARSISFRRLDDPDRVVVVGLEDGSLLWMRGTTNAHYEHAVLPVDAPTPPRLSVTFRFVLEPAAAGV